MLHHPPVLLKPPESRNLRDRATSWPCSAAPAPTW
jgi:hypothetical protein